MLPGKQFTPSEITQILRRRLWLLILPPLVTAFAALLYSARVPNLYQSDMLIAIDPQRVPEGFVQSTVTLRTDRRMDAISVQVLSRTNLERMIESLGLYATERKVLPMEDVVVRMRDSIITEMERPKGPGREMDGPSAFHVRFTYRDANVAAQVTQQLGSLFVEQNARDRDGLAKATNTFLETQLAESRQRLEVQERRLEAFRERYGNELPTQMTVNMQASMSTQLQIQTLVESLARDRDRKLLLERLHREAAEAPIPAPAVVQQQPANGPGVTLSATAPAQQQLLAARAMLANLELRFRAEHPDVVRTKRLIADLEAKAKNEETIAAERQANNLPATPVVTTDPLRRERLGAMVAEIESLDRQIAFKEKEEQRLRGEIAEYQRRVEAVPGRESEFVALTRDYETQQSAYKELLSKSGAAKIAVDLEQQQIGEHFRIVDPAGVPVHPLPSMRMRINAGGLALGLMIGLGIAALLELKDASFRSDEDVLESLSLPVLASIPRIHTAAELRWQRRRNVLLSVTGAACLAGASYVTWTLKLWNSLI